MGGSPLGPRARTGRPTALLSAVATFLGALFICLGPPAEHHGRLVTLAPSAQLVPSYSCPFDDGSCGLLPKTVAAVLTTPPPDAPDTVEERLPRPDPAAGPGVALRTPAQPRAPDLHVLQVLRT
ncbi:hypothetical protein [Streptomyces sp. NPDC014894]|uniref:hypothetical protein n=1 Tax=unclassified Streptomyces TaxID=2593676 RepID=UPI003702607C